MKGVGLVEVNGVASVPASQMLPLALDIEQSLTQHCAALKPESTLGYTTTFFLQPMIRNSTSPPCEVTSTPLLPFPLVLLGSYDVMAKEWALRA